MIDALAGDRLVGGGALERTRSAPAARAGRAGRRAALAQALPGPGAPARAWLAVAATLGRRLSRPLDRALEPLGVRAASLSVLPRAQPPLPDAPARLLVSAAGRPVAVLACALAGPLDAVREEAARALAAAAALGPDLGRAVLAPVTVLERGGASWALYPYGRPLARLRGLRWLQRRWLAEPLFEWLDRTVSVTREAPSLEAGAAFADRLEWVAAQGAFGWQVRARAQRALQRLRHGVWAPRRVLSHGDLWLGNVLLPPGEPWAPPAGGWPPFVLIDWRGAETRGYALYDLLRLADSLRVPRERLRRAVSRQTELLGCHLEDASGHLLAALGHLGRRLELFDPARYVAMAERLVADLAGVGL